jgi:vacuolar protein sorting-associated protein IST1
VENIIRGDITTELHEILELYCELLLARSQLLDTSATSPLRDSKSANPEAIIDPGLEEAVRSIIYAAPRTEIKELNQARVLMVEKFGKDFALSAMEEKGVADRVLKKLAVSAPDQALVDGYLREIARTYGVRFPGDPLPEDEEEEEEAEDDDDQPSGGSRLKELEAELEAESEELSKATPPRDIGIGSPVRIAPQSPSTENPTAKIKLPGPGKGDVKPKPTRKASASGESKKKGGDGGGPGGKIPEIDDLAARFAALKKL